MKREDSMFVVREQRSLTATILVCNFTDQLPLDQEHHNSLLELSKKTDVYLIFPSTVPKTVNFEKFTNLYDFCGYVVSKQPLSKVVTSLMFTFDYLTTINSRYISYLTGDLTDFINMDTIQISKVIYNTKQLEMYNVKSVVGKAIQLSSEEYYEIYKEPIPEKKSWWLLKESTKSYNDLMYYRFKSGSDFLYFRKNHIVDLLSFESKPEGMSYIDTFSGDIRINDFLCSYIKYSGITNISFSVEDLDINSLKS